MGGVGSVMPISSANGQSTFVVARHSCPPRALSVS